MGTDWISSKSRARVTAQSNQIRLWWPCVTTAGERHHQVLTRLATPGSRVDPVPRSTKRK